MLPEQKQVCENIMKDFAQEIKVFPGSKSKHQIWKGGYLDHVLETMNIAVSIYKDLNSKRLLSFNLSDALFILFIHDLDKLLRYGNKNLDKSVGHEDIFDLVKKKYKYQLKANEKNAIKYVHGEGKDYHPTKKIMKPLACFAHCCDIISARIWFYEGRDKQNW